MGAAITVIAVSGGTSVAISCTGGGGSGGDGSAVGAAACWRWGIVVLMFHISLQS